MLRALFRFVGYLVLAVAFIDFVVDGARSVANDELSFLSIRGGLDAVLSRGPGGWEETLKLRLPGFLWDPLLTGILAAPFFIGTALLALILLLLGRKPRARIGYSSRD